jgi:hypothetical protein
MVTSGDSLPHSLAEAGQIDRRQPMTVGSTARPVFLGQAVRQVASDTLGATGTLTMALLRRAPQLTRLVQHTHGLYFDVVLRNLTSSIFELPDFVSLTQAREPFEGRLPRRDVRADVFPRSGSRAEQDAALARTSDVLAIAAPFAHPHFDSRGVAA